MKIFKFCKFFILKYKKLFICYIFLNILAGIFNIATPLFTGKIIDNLTYTKSKELLIIYCTLFATVSLANMLTGFLSSFIYVKLQTQSGYALNKHVIDHLQNISILHYKNTDTVYLNQRINNDSNVIIIFCIETIVNIVVNITIFIFTVILLININYKIAIILAVLAIMYIIIYSVFKKSLYEKSFEVKEAQSNFFSKLNEQLFNIRFIKTHSVKYVFAKRLDKTFNTLIRKLVSSQKLTYIYTSCDSLIGLFAQLIIFLVGGIAIINGQMTIGFYVIMANYFKMIINSLKYFFSLGKTYQDNLVSYNRIIDILTIPLQNYGKYQIDNIKSIEIEDLTFSYNDKEIYNSYSIKFEKGKIYNLIGHNGVGKSTLTDLMLGLYLDDYEGEIRYNNIDIKKIDMHNLRLKNIAVTEQEPILIPDTLINNITMEKDYNINLVNKYINILGLDKYVLSLEDGLNTVINEKSNNISGGEKQKISILRQFIKDSDVMILDEPTSALDAKSRERLRNHLCKIKENKIIIVISHDSFMNDICDEIIDLNKKDNTTLDIELQYY